MLVERGLVETRAKAQALIMAGKVFAEGRRIDKVGTQIWQNAEVRVVGETHAWVSRGGLKLAHALNHFGIDPKGCTCVDIGASTGGFTDVLLANGAAKIYAVDVGRGQLAWKLQTNNRVVVMDKTNARYLTHADIPVFVDLIVCDASFISLKTILPATLNLTRPGSQLIALIKPQFEVGREKVGKRGIVSNPALHNEVCRGIRLWIDQMPGWNVYDISESPITGIKGNKEFFIWAQFTAD